MVIVDTDGHRLWITCKLRKAAPETGSLSPGRLASDVFQLWVIDQVPSDWMEMTEGPAAVGTVPS